VVLATDGTGLFMHWPSGEASGLIPLVAKDHFVDRAYWEEIVIERDSSGHPNALLCDQFKGMAANQ
jgi:hypothetical protein